MLLQRSSLLGGSAVTAQDYEQEGLVALWDAKENAGWGTHDASATTWLNLVDQTSSMQNYNGANVPFWFDNAFAATSVKGFYNDKEISFTSNVKTIEVVVTPFYYQGSNGFIISNRDNGVWTTGSFQLLRTIGNYTLIGNGVTVSRLAFDTESINTPVRNAFTLTGDLANNVFSIAAEVGGYAGTFSGLIHCVRVYDKLLSTEELAANRAVDVARFGLT